MPEKNRKHHTWHTHTHTELMVRLYIYLVSIEEDDRCVRTERPTEPARTVT